jgi:hypothetical protein
VCDFCVLSIHMIRWGSCFVPHLPVGTGTTDNVSATTRNPKQKKPSGTPKARGMYTYPSSILLRAAKTVESSAILRHLQVRVGRFKPSTGQSAHKLVCCVSHWQQGHQSSVRLHQGTQEQARTESSLQQPCPLCCLACHGSCFCLVFLVATLALGCRSLH